MNKKTKIFYLACVLFVAVVLVLVSVIFKMKKNENSDTEPPILNTENQTSDNSKEPEEPAITPAVTPVTTFDIGQEYIDDTSDFSDENSGNQYIVHEDGTREVIHPDGTRDIYKPIDSADAPEPENNDWSEEYVALVQRWTDIMIGSVWQGSFDEYDREGTFWIFTFNEDTTFTHYNANSEETHGGIYEMIFQEYGDDMKEPTLRLNMDDNSIIEYTFSISERYGEVRLNVYMDDSGYTSVADVLTTPLDFHPVYFLVSP